jgi:cholesterol transport system auxiliary component
VIHSSQAAFRSTSLRLAAAALALPLMLGGCISVFPKAKPVQLYRFGQQVPAAAGAASGLTKTVLKGPTVFPPAASGDRMLTANGAETAYIGGARWNSPASVMFEEDLMRAFDSPGAPRLVERGEPLAAPSVLRLDVRRFEAQYPGPTVVVQVRASLIRNLDHSLISEKMFEASVPASDNRQTAIVAAYDGAVVKVIGDIRAWTDATAPAK